MYFRDLPTDIVVWILNSFGLLDLVRCQSVCRSLRYIIQNSPWLVYKMDMELSGYTDKHVHPRYTLETRRRMLENAQRVWKRPGRFTPVGSLSCTNLFYWLVREGVLLRPRDWAQRHRSFEVSIISHKPLRPPIVSWQLNLSATESGISWVDTTQNLLVVRPLRTSHEQTDVTRFSCSPLCLLTGAPHPLARRHEIDLKVSDRVLNKPHHTRIQVFGTTLAINQASSVLLFSEVSLYNWQTGEQLAIFPSTPTASSVLGGPCVLISEDCFLLVRYAMPEGTPSIEVYAIDTGKPLQTIDGDTFRPVVHIATYTLPRTCAGDLRVVLTPSAAYRAPSDHDIDGYVASDPHSLMLHVHFSGVEFMDILRRPLDAMFFTPLRPFLLESESYFSLRVGDRRDFTPHIVPWDQWQHNTRWLVNDGPLWMQEVRRGQKGVGSRYVFSRHIVDFSPMELAQEVFAQRQLDPDVGKFDSGVGGFETYCDTPATNDITGIAIFWEPIRGSLPYRQKMLPEMLGLSRYSDFHLIGDKVVNVEGGIRDEVKIYQLEEET